ncbi:MAG TPA: glutamate 5-kinase [Symbiobacteriaceae bacterium]|nr:glutamate 5-kinase [Symbiobacteriaceae bacterium]
MRTAVSRSQRIVIKVGTSTLTHPGGHLHLGRMEALVRQLSDLAAEGRQLVLVTSGAVGAGMGRLGLERRPAETLAKQALAALGQGLLMHRYEALFAEYGRPVGQILLTGLDLEDQHRRAIAAGVISQLLTWGAIPIVNENDSVSSEQIRVGDNDTLAARVAGMIGADLLVLLSDVDGLYTEDPRGKQGLSPLTAVTAGDDLDAMAGGAGSAGGTGGMVTKVQAARICAGAGIPMVLANGALPGVLRSILAGETVGTLFREVAGV